MHVTLQNPCSKRQVIDGGKRLRRCLAEAVLLGHVILLALRRRRRWLRGFFGVASSVMEIESVLLGHVILLALRRRWLRDFFRVASSVMEIELSRWEKMKEKRE
ncbi:unnamed protein product [Musa textilis]